MVVVAMAVVILNCAAAFNAIATIPLLLLLAVATNAIAALPFTAATQSTTATTKAVVDKWLTLAVDGASNGIATAAINHSRTVNDSNHLAFVVVNCAVAFNGGGIDGGC
jgi:hypothetical protein